MKNRVYQIEVVGQTLWVTVNGLSNQRTTKAYVEDFRQNAAALVNAPWACVLDLRLWLPSPHDALTLLQDNTRWCYAHGLACVVVILPSDAVSAWQYLKATEVAAPPAILRQQAQSPEQAQAFLRQHGYWI